MKIVKGILALFLAPLIQVGVCGGLVGTLRYFHGQLFLPALLVWAVLSLIIIVGYLKWLGRLDRTTSVPARPSLSTHSSPSDSTHYDDDDDDYVSYDDRYRRAYWEDIKDKRREENGFVGEFCHWLFN